MGGKNFRRPAYSLGQKTDRSFSGGEDNTVGSYIKHFDLDNSFQGKHVHVFFEGVERAMFVWLNGHFIDMVKIVLLHLNLILPPTLKKRTIF